MIEDALGPRVFVGDHSGIAHFRSRARRGGHRDQGGDGRSINFPVTRPAHGVIQGRSIVACLQGDGLGRVHGRSTADGDDAVTPAVPEGGGAGGDVRRRGVGFDLGKHLGIQARVGQGRPRRRDDAGCRKTRVGHDQGPLDAQARRRLAQFDQASGAEAHGGGKWPVGGQSGSVGGHDERHPVGRLRGRQFPQAGVKCPPP